MEQNFNRRIETDLDLNGPHLAISSHPSDATVSDGATQTFSVTASATFPGNTGADNEGTLTYQWYEDDEGSIKKLENETVGVTYSGVTTATLTLTGISSPAENGHKYYCVIDYIPADRYAHAEKGTGHPINGTVTSNSATLTVNPYIQILSQPSSVDRIYDVNGEITVTAVLSDSDYTDDIGYQWYRNGNAISDGRVTTTRIERGTVTEVIKKETEEEYVVYNRYNYSYNNTFYGNNANTHAVPNTASNVKIKIAGGAGGKGGEDAPWNIGGDGGSGMYGEFTLSRSANTTLTMYAGKKGSDGTHGQGSAGGAGGGYGGFSGGGNGGGAGGSGASGGGGGGGGASAVYAGQESTPIIVAGGGGGGGGGSNYNLPGVDPGKAIDVNYTYLYPRQRLGVHDNGKRLDYGDTHGSDANGQLFITSGNAKFTSMTQMVGSGPVRLQYNWNDNPNYADQANKTIGIGVYGTLVHESTRSGTDSLEFTMPGNAGAKNAGGWVNKGSTTIYSDGGHGGHPCNCSDGAGGGGGGAGYVSSPGAGGGTGGAGGCDGVSGGTAGNGGESAFRTDYTTGYPSDGFNYGQGYVQLSYDYYVDVSETKTRTVVTYEEIEKEIENSIPQNIDFEGTQSKTLKVKADYNTVENLYCVVSSPTATNSPVTTNTVQFSSFSTLSQKTLYMEQAFWSFSQWRGGSATGAMGVAISNADLNNGEITIGYDDGTAYEDVDATVGTQDDIVRRKGINVYTSFYVTSDTEVEIDLHGGRGVPWTTLTNTDAPGSFPDVHNRAGELADLAAGQGPGEGGYGRIRFTMKANREYTVAGMFSTINTPYLYELDELIAVVGQGGGNNVYGEGGGGGGFNMRAEDGTNSGGWAHNSGYGSANPNWGYNVGANDFEGQIKLQARLGSAYFPYRTDWRGSFYNDMLDWIAKNVDYAQYGIDGGRVKRYSRSINNNSDISTRKMWTRQGNGYSSGLPEHEVMENTATIQRGFWDIDYSFLGTAGGRGDVTRKTDQASLESMALAKASGLYDSNCVGGNGAMGGGGGKFGTGGGGGGGWLNLQKDITLVSTNNGRTGGGTEDSKIVIRLAT